MKTMTPCVYVDLRMGVEHGEQVFEHRIAGVHDIDAELRYRTNTSSIVSAL